MQAFFASAECTAVLTAHPTEVRRRSSIDREMEVARLLDERDRGALTPEELAANDKALRRAVLTLWQTSILRGTRLRVIDEVVNGLAYYDHTFLRELPRFYVDLEDHLGGVDAAWNGIEIKPSCLRIGSWIGGDRDGNPFVTAEALERVAAAQSGACCDSTSTSCTSWAEIVARSPHGRDSDGLQRAGGAIAGPLRSRQDQPYRRAIAGMYARLAATAWTLDQVEALRHAVGDAPAYAAAAELRADLETIRRRSTANGSATWRRDGCAPAPRRRTYSASTSPADRSAAEFRRARAGRARAVRCRRRRAARYREAGGACARHSPFWLEIGNLATLVSQHLPLFEGNGRGAGRS